MIRMTLAFFVFALVLCAFIILRPGRDAPRAQAPDMTPDVEVTRAVMDPLLTPPAAPETVVVAEPVAAPVVAAPAPRATPQIATIDSSMQATTAAVLAGLGVQTGAEPLPAPATDEMRDATVGILSNITAMTGAPAPEITQRPTLDAIVVQALQEGQSDDYIDALINAAAATGDLAVPEILVTSDGRVDTAVLLADIVAQATVATGGQINTAPAIDLDESAGVEVRIVQRADETVQARFYTVQAGDSLGAIAIKFFGDVNRYTTIFEANRGTLSSPDRIRTGQRLVIPNEA